jgi:hypothetical protein
MQESLGPPKTGARKPTNWVIRLAPTLTSLEGADVDFNRPSQTAEALQGSLGRMGCGGGHWDRGLG